jgi:hypothetical protein
MKKQTACKQFEELIKKLKPQKIIHTSNRGFNFHFLEYKNNRLYFNIPNHVSPKNPNKKSITDKQFCQLIIMLNKQKILRTSNFPFQDCRVAAFRGFLNILNSKSYINSRGIITLVKNKLA